MKLPKFKLSSNGQKRSKLHEGINYGMGFQFLKRVGTQLLAIQPLSPCKDYLAEIIYSQKTGLPSSAHGLSVKDEKCFEHGEGYLAFGICKQGRALTEYSNYKRDYNTLESNYKNLEKFINIIENKIGLKTFTKIVKLKENRYMAILPLYWTETTYIISLYSLLLRAGYFYESGDIIEYLKNFDKNSNDVYLLKTAMPKLLRVLDGEVPTQDMKTIGCPHNLGIVSWKMPAKPISSIAGASMVKMT
jgi:hypothetical protein